MKVGRKRINEICQERIRAIKLYLETTGSIKDIAASVGVSRMSVHRWIKRYNWNQLYREHYEKELEGIDDETDKFIYIHIHRSPKKDN